MGYLDVTDAWLRELTRQRRRERAEALARPTIRYSAAPPTYHHEARDRIAQGSGSRRELAAPNTIARREWKEQQWAAGVVQCGYCAAPMVRDPNLLMTCTVDHRQALARGGTDVEENWLLCCAACNTRKGLMDEVSFRALLAAKQPD